MHVITKTMVDGTYPGPVVSKVFNASAVSPHVVSKAVLPARRAPAQGMTPSQRARYRTALLSSPEFRKQVEIRVFQKLKAAALALGKGGRQS